MMLSVISWRRTLRAWLLVGVTTTPSAVFCQLGAGATSLGLGEKKDHTSDAAPETSDATFDAVEHAPTSASSAAAAAIVLQFFAAFLAIMSVSVPIGDLADVNTLRA
jgi:hypothetical protein